MKYIKILFGIALLVIAFTVGSLTCMCLMTTEPSKAFKALVDILIKSDRLYALYLFPLICAICTMGWVVQSGLDMLAEARRKKRERIKELQDEYYEEIEKENYERCAEIRDEIKRLKDYS